MAPLRGVSSTAYYCALDCGPLVFAGDKESQQKRWLKMLGFALRFYRSLSWQGFLGLKLGGILEYIFGKKHGTAVSAVAYLSYTVGCFFVCRLGKGLICLE